MVNAKTYYQRIYLIFLLALMFLPAKPNAQAPLRDSTDRHIHESYVARMQMDSIQRQLEKATDDTSRILLLVQLSNLESNYLKDASTSFGERAVTLSKKIHFEKGEALAYRTIGGIYQVRKDYQTAIYYFKLAIEKAEENSSVSPLELYPTLLNLYFYLGNYPEAMAAVTHEMELYEKEKNKEGIAHCNNLLGYIHLKQENFPEAEKFYGRYIQNAKELKDSTMLVHALGEVSDVYTEEKEYDRSIDTLLKLVEICKHGIVRRGAASFGGGWLPQYRLKAMFRLGRNYKLKGELDKALEYALHSIENSPYVGVTDYDSSSYYINIGDIYKKMHNYDKALFYLNGGFEIARRIQHNENTRDAAEYISEIYSDEKKYDSAFTYYYLFTKLKDSIVNEQTKIRIASIQGQYDITKKDREIARQNQFRNILVGVFAFLLLGSLFLYNRYRLKQKNRYQMELNRQQNELFNAIASAQDQERKRIAQDIHDSLGAILSAAKLRLSALKDSEGKMPDGMEEKYQTTLQLLDEASSELRNISHNIMPATLSKLGLVAALKNLSNTISSYSGLQINFTAHEFNERIDEHKEISIYRIILELINNVVKHASASKVTVQLVRYPDSINVTVEDNGKGFDYSRAIEEKKGIGLGNILSRVEYLKGRIHVDAAPGRGTTVIIDVPLKKSEA